MAPRLQAAGASRDTVFVPVATPGLNAAGHLFRTDGIVIVPLVAIRDDGLRGVDSILAALADALPAAAPEAAQ
jgi:formylmethanofuran dehydrogenase subunit B